jgi:uncharacterized phage protein gp47/JayE
MPFDRPTLTQLRQQIAADIGASLPGADALLRYSNLGIIGDVQAGALSGLYGYLDWIAREGVPFTATEEFLEGWAALKGVTRKPAVAAAGFATFTGASGAVIAAGSPVSGSGGANYTVTADTPVSGGSALVPLVATSLGVAGNIAAGAAVTLSIAIVGVNSTGLAAGPISGGTDVEDDASLRSRMLATYAAPPQGGAASDYATWARDVPGVTRAWAVGNALGAGTVSVYFMMDVIEAAHGGFPQGTNGVSASETRDAPASGDQLLVADALYPVQPVTALVYALAPTANVIGLTIAGIAGASTATRAAIAAAFASALSLDASPGGVTRLSTIETAIGGIAAAAGFVITAITASAGTVTTGATGNISSNPGALSAPGAISFV